MNSGFGTIVQAALDYAKRGWKPIPISRRTKRAIDKSWQKRPFNPAQFNGNGQNVGIQLGAVSGGLTDVDLDCAEAIGLALEFLPPTGAIFGRHSKPCSHQLYVTSLHETETNAGHVNTRVGGYTLTRVMLGPPSKEVAHYKLTQDDGATRSTLP